MSNNYLNNNEIEASDKEPLFTSTYQKHEKRGSLQRYIRKKRIEAFF